MSPDGGEATGSPSIFENNPYTYLSPYYDMNTKKRKRSESFDLNSRVATFSREFGSWVRKIGIQYDLIILEI